MSNRQKAKAAEDLGMFFLEKGGILTESEFKLAGKTPIRYSRLKSFFGSWPKAVDSIRRFTPAIWAELHAPKPTPKARPKPKPAVKVPEIKTNWTKPVKTAETKADVE